ncbi:MAG TPA: DASS family sodium-coupled anion symporter [Chitinophagaceae bacterium]|nr:DASS family sodium-coupled anion symporter [Chitinophagaceae bacterium]
MSSESFISRNGHYLSISAGLALSILMWALNPFHLDQNACRVIAVAALMITWWITEALPMPVVALLPIVLFPLFKISTIKETTAPYANEVVFLFMGGFMIGLAIEKWSLHKRIALSIVNYTGTSGNRIILGFILATGLISMWISNTATTMMMFPIAISVINVIGNGKDGTSMRNFSLCLMLAIAYASNFGGIATIIGTPPNVAYVSYISKKFNYEISFFDWAVLCLPIALTLMFSLYFVSVKILFPNKISSSPEMQELIRSELLALGPLSKSEKRVLTVFLFTALMWMTRDLINQLGIVKLDDNMIAIMGALLLFIVPSGVNGTKLLDWSDTSKMAWGILLLFGGGITLATAMEKAGLMDMLGQWIASYSGTDLFVLLVVVTTVTIFLSEVMSNIAQVIVFAPVVTSIAQAAGLNPLVLGIGMTLAASCASMMPMGTPPNAIVFASGHVRMKDMMKAGLVMNLISILLIVLFCYYLLPGLMKIG